MAQKLKEKTAFILDPACGSRMFWFNKGDKRVLFTDIRDEQHTLCDGRKLVIKPDLKMDFRKLKFRSKSFKLVVFDPPHLSKVGEKSWMAKKYGVLSENWQQDLSQGFKECWRVLEDYGVLVFKWAEKDIPTSKVLKLFDQEPLFGHTTRNGGHTMWFCFIKVPEQKKHAR